MSVFHLNKTSSEILSERMDTNKFADYPLKKLEQKKLGIVLARMIANIFLSKIQSEQINAQGEINLWL